jgi:hypothetical protein
MPKYRQHDQPQEAKDKQHGSDIKNRNTLRCPDG